MDISEYVTDAKQYRTDDDDDNEQIDIYETAQDDGKHKVYSHSHTFRSVFSVFSNFLFFLFVWNHAQFGATINDNVCLRVVICLPFFFYFAERIVSRRRRRCK